MLDNDAVGWLVFFAIWGVIIYGVINVNVLRDEAKQREAYEREDAEEERVRFRAFVKNLDQNRKGLTP